MSTFTRISTDQAQTMISESSVNILDMRDARSFGMGRIPKSIRIDNDNVQQIISETDKDIDLIICCYNGNISQSGADYFAKQGYKNVYSLDGGFNRWKLILPTEVEL